MAARNFSRFLQHSKGTVAPLFAIAAIPLVVAMGAVVDYNNAYDQRSVVQDSMDSAALAAGKKIGLVTMDQLQTDVNNYYTTNVGARIAHPPALQVALQTSTITLNTTLTVPTYFLGLIGLHQLNFNITSQATLAFGTLEVAMVLDNSGSMQTNNNIATLRTAATNLTNTLYGLGATSTRPDPVKVSIVPFAGSVNVGPAFRTDVTATWLDKTGSATYALDSIDGAATTYNAFNLFDSINGASWGGCVEMRPMPNDIVDGGADPTIPATLFTPMFAPDEPDNWTCSTGTCSNVDRNLSDSQNTSYLRYNGAPSGGTANYNNYLPDAGTASTCPANYPSITSVNTASDLLTTTAAHGLAAGNQVYFEVGAGGTLPTGLSANTRYYVIATGLTTTAFKVSTTPGGTAKDITATGSGLRYAVKVMNWTCSNGTANCAGTSNGKSETSAFTGANVSGSTMCKYGTAATKSTPAVITGLGSGATAAMIGPGGPNAFCTTTPIRPLTTAQASVTTAISNMAALGITNIQEGLMWGWRTLSPGAPFTEGRSYATGDNQKIIVLMTDGENTYFPKTNSTLLKSWYGSWGFITKNHLGTTSTDTATVEAAMDARTALACAAVKTTGIKVYTVAFTGSGGISASTQSMLQTCASDPSMYYLAANQAALLSAFQAIGDNISLLRISQ